MRRWNMISVACGLCAGALLACSTNSADDCSVGALDCACTAGGGCDPGLDCVEGTCIVVTTETTNSAGGTNGPTSTTGAQSGATSDTPTTAETADDTSQADASSGDGGVPVLDVGNQDTDIGPSSGCRAIDILFALDSSGSMLEERAALSATNAFSQILTTLEGLNGGGIDYRVGLTTANDHGWIVPLGWLEPNPWFDSQQTELNALSVAFNSAVGQLQNLGDIPAGCEHALTSGINLLASDTTGFVRDDALLVLVLLTDVDDFGAYDQIGGNSCSLGCASPPSDLEAMRSLLVDSIKSGVEESVAVIAIAGDPTVEDGLNFCNQPGSCGCGGLDCEVFHATRLYAFAELLGERGIAADLCGANVPGIVEETLTGNIDQICQDFQPEG